MEHKNQRIRISAVVCTYNRAHLLPFCLRSLVNQTLDKSLYEVIVVDNNSSDGTSRVVNKFADEYPNLRVVREKKQGLSHARNRGYYEACGEFIAYIDDDAKADKDWIKKILRAFETVSPSPSAVGGKVLPYYLSEKPGWFLDTYEVRTWGEDSGFLQKPRASSGFSGSNMAFPKKLLEQYGGFSPDFGMKGERVRLAEETVLFRQIYQDLPYFWYAPEIKVKHLVSERYMNIWYRLKRAFMEGVASARIRNDKPAFLFISKNLVMNGVYVVLLLFLVRWWKRRWQRDLQRYAVPIARSFGRIIGTLNHKIL